MSECIRTGVVGFGKMGLLHGSLVSIREDMELVAICEKTMFVRKAFKSVMRNINFYSDYKKMIEKEELDAVIITTPTFNHAEVAAFAAEKGLAVFCEKPLAINGEEAAGLAKLFDEKNIPSLVGFSNRFFPTIAEGKKLVDERVVGEIQTIKSEMYIGDVFKDNSGWRYDPKLSGGGALIDFGIHMVDMLDWYFGKIVSVTAWTKNIYSKNVEDEAGGEIFFDNGLKASFITSWSKAEYRKSSPIITVEGTEGKLIVTEQTIDIIKGDDVKQITYPDLYKGDYADIAGINYSLEMKTFVEEMKGNRSHMDMAQGAHIQRVVDAMYESAKTGKRVEVQG